MHPRGRTTYQNVTASRRPTISPSCVKLSKPSPILMKSLSSYESQIIPKHIFDEAPIRHAIPACTRRSAPGRSCSRNGRRASTSCSSAIPNYWDQPKPYLDEIVLKIIPDRGRDGGRASRPARPISASSTPSRSPTSSGSRRLPKLAAETKGYEYLRGPVPDRAQHPQRISARSSRPAGDQPRDRPQVPDRQRLVRLRQGGDRADPVDRVEYYTRTSRLVSVRSPRPTRSSTMPATSAAPRHALQAASRSCPSAERCRRRASISSRRWQGRHRRRAAQSSISAASSSASTPTTTST